MSCADDSAYVVMITGGIGSGKSELTRLLRERGAATLDLDGVARAQIDLNESLRAELAARFGADILDDDGALDRAVLAKRAFASFQDAQDMNAITFPYIIEAASDTILNCHCSRSWTAPLLVVEVPLLDQAPELAQLADEVIAIVAPDGLRLQRAVDRGMSPGDVLARMSIQASDDKRLALADTVCDNSGSAEDLAHWVDDWFASKENVFYR